MMKKIYVFGTILMILIIGIISGCVEEYEVSTPPPSGTATPRPTPAPTVSPTISATIDPVKILHTPSWTNKLGWKTIDVTISDNGEYYGGLSLHKAIIKTPARNILANLYWKNGNLISLSPSGEYVGIADENFIRIYDNNGDSLVSYDANGNIHQIAIFDNGNIIQSSEKKPHISIIDKKGVVLWEWNLGISTAKDLVFDYSDNMENIFIGTYEGKIYYVSNDLRNLWTKDLKLTALDVKMSGDGESMYVLTDDKKLHSYDKYGNSNWVKGLTVDTIEIDISDSGDYILTKPVNSANIPSFVYKVQLLDRNGQVKWQKSVRDMGVMGMSEDARYIVISEDRDLRMYDIDGNELSSYHLDSTYGLFFVSLDMTPDASKLVLGTTRSVLVFG